MAMKRYKAGTIFLDVAPSFDQVQNAIRDFVKKDQGLNDAFEEQGRQAGENFAEGEAEGYAKASKKAGEARLKQTKAVNQQSVASAADAAKQMAKAIEKGQEQQTAAVKQGADERAQLRLDESKDAVALRKKLAQDLQKIRDDEAKEARARKRTADREAAKDALALRRKLAKDMAAIQDKSRADAAAKEKAGIKSIGNMYRRAVRENGFLLDQMNAERQALANEMADGHAAVIAKQQAADEEHSRVHRERLAEGVAAEKDYWQSIANLQEEADANHQATLDDMTRAADAVRRHEARAEEQHLKEREKRVRMSGGRIGKIIRRSVGTAIEDLPVMQITADSSHADKVVDGIRNKLMALRDAEIDVDISTGDAMAATRQIRAELRQIARTHPEVSVRVNAMAALAELNAIERQTEKMRRDAKRPIIYRIATLGGAGSQGGLGDDGANAFRIFNAMALAVATALAILGPLLAVVAAGLVTVAGAAIASAGALGILALGFQGVFSAIQDQIKAEDDLGKRSQMVARQRATSARAVRDAKERLADAERNAARASEDAARRVSDAQRDLADARRDAQDSIEGAIQQQVDAERRLQDAQEAATRAQEDLNRARRDAKREIEDLSMAYDSAKLDEKEAQIAIAQAQARLGDVRRRAWSGDASQADVRQAQVDVQQARLRAEQATIRRQRAGQDSARASRLGVEGSEQVRDAKSGVADAARAEVTAQRGVAEAVENVAETRRSAARSVADAERSVTDALKAQRRVAADSARSIRDAQQAITDAQEAAAVQAEAMSSAAYDAQKSMRELTPEGRRFAGFILSLRGEYQKLRDLAQANMLPGLQEGMQELSIYKDGFRTFVDDMSATWGRGFASMGEQLTNPRWQSFFNTLGKDGPKQAGLFGQSLFNVAEAIAGIVDAFSPMTTDMLTWLEDATGGWADWAAGLKGSPEFERFMGYIRDTAPIVKDFLLALGDALINLGVAMAPFSEGILKTLTNFFEFVADMDPKTLGLIAAAVVSLFVAFQFGAGAMQLVTTLLTPFHNRLALIVTVVTLAVFALIYLYQTNETARKIIDKFIGVLKDMAAWVGRNADAIKNVALVMGGLYATYQLVRFAIIAYNAVIAAKLALTYSMRAAQKAYTIAMLGGTAAQKGGTAATIVGTVVGKARLAMTKAMTVAQRALNLVMRMNPIGILITAIIALVAIFVVLYKKNETARRIMDAAWRGIKMAIFGVVNWFKKVAWPWMRDVYNNLKDATKVAAAVIGDQFNKIKGGVDKVKDGFDKAIKGIKKAWEGLKQIIANPIDSALQYIQLNFINGINKLLKKAGLDLQIPDVWTPRVRSRGHGSRTGSYRAAGLATGGILPGYTPMAKGDDQLRPMRSGEGVLVSEGLRDDRSKSMFLAANEAAKRGVSFADYFAQGYAKGGIVDLGKRLQDMGYHVSEHPAFGGVAPGAHSASGYHYKGGALDINADSWNSKFGNEMAALDRLNAMLRGEGWNTIWRAANHFDHLHVDIAKGQRGGGGFMDKVWGFLFDKAEGIIDKIPGDNIFAKSGKGFLKKSLSGWESMILDEAGSLDTGEGSVGGGRGGVRRWGGVVSEALNIMGQSPLLLNTTLRRMQQESSGNPRIVNTWDSNAARGTPSKGLMQVIDPTFRAYAHPRYDDNIFDPLSNILASMRYALARYGSLSAAYNRAGGYATGTDSATAGWHMVGEEGPELMRFTGGEQVYNRQQTLRLAELSAKGGGGGFSGTVLVQNPWTGEYHEAKMQEIVDDNNDFNNSVGRMGPRG